MPAARAARQHLKLARNVIGGMLFPPSVANWADIPGVQLARLRWICEEHASKPQEPSSPMKIVRP